MTIPHEFPSLLSGPAQIIVIAGTGLSASVAPTVNDLKPELDILGESLTDPVADADFYVLAEEIIKRLEAEGKSTDESKLFLAESLGMFRDRRWFGEVKVPLSGNTPRHRVLARLAVEKRLRAIISLNWDALLEAGLDSVGLTEFIPSARPWDMTQYQRIIEDVDLPRLASNQTFPVIKPHGCVRELERAHQEVTSGKPCPHITFKITASELNVLPARQTGVDKKVEGYVRECPVLAVGWKASEKYLRNMIISAITAAKPEGTDPFTLISRTWYKEHEEIAQVYNAKERTSFLAAGRPGDPTLDLVFKWLQALYFLRLIAGSLAGEQKQNVEKLYTQIAASCVEHPVLNWADTWVPLWVRMCWRAGFVQGVNPATNERIEPADIPIAPHDVHVPIGTITLERRDLQAAGKLLITIQNNWGSYDFEKFPGALWNEKKQTIYLPVPGGRRSAQPSALSALKPMIDTWTWHIKTIRLVWLDAMTSVPTVNDKHQLEAQIRMLLPLTASVASIPLSWVPLSTLKGA